MASRLVGLMRVLEWTDYPHRNSPAPGAGVTAFAAQTATNILSSGWGVQRVTGGVTMADTLEITVQFVRGNSWVENWAFSQSAAYQSNLLTHERGHYQLAGLLARDAFLAIMRLKANVYTTSSSLQNDIRSVSAATLAKAQALDQKYEDDTTHGQDATEQTAWNGYIQTAFSQPAVPAQTTPDSVVVKTPILSVLAANSIRI